MCEEKDQRMIMRDEMNVSVDRCFSFCDVVADSSSFLLLS